MKILKEEIEHMYGEIGYVVRNRHEDVELNCLLNYWCFLEEKEVEILEVINETLDVILYSKYYWSTKYIQKYTKSYGQDAGLEQQHYKIIEEMDQRLDDVDWEMIEEIDTMIL